MATETAERELIRSMPFELTRSEPEGDGLTFEGYAAVFNTPTRIRSWEGEFDEQIAPGAFSEYLEQRMPVLMFEHGQHPLIGSMPLGVIQEAREDDKGLFIRARLSDNWLIQPVRDAVRDGAVQGMSFRFSSPGPEDERWERRTGRPDLRTLLRLSVPELGPVVFPAYEPTTAAVRSLVEKLPPVPGEEEQRSDDEAAEAENTSEDFTGRSDARSTDGGDTDSEPRDGDESPNCPETLERVRIDTDTLRLERILR